NDAVRAMRWCGWLLAAAAVACSRDPSLAISVHHPAGYGVVQTVVTVYVGDDIACNEIEHGDRTDAELEAITVDKVDVTDGGDIQVGRLGGKSIVARGYDAQHQFVTAGCKDLGEIAGATQFTIETQPTAAVAIDPGPPDRPFTGRMIVVNMSDTNGKVLDGTVSWELSGPAGAATQTESAGMPTRNGNVRIEVSDLGQPGPEGLRIRAPWATAPVPLVTGFDLSHDTTIQLGGGTVASHPSCDVRGHVGRLPTLICLTQATVGGHRDAIEIGWQDGQFKVLQPIAIPAGLDNQFALFVDHDGLPDESVYVLSANAAGAGSWYKLGAGSGSAVAFGAALQNVVYVPRCAHNSTTALVAVQTGTALGVANQVRLFLPSGTPVNAAVDGEVFSGGCIDDVDGKQHQGLVVAGAAGDAFLELIIPGSGMAMPVSAAKFTGTGFVTVETKGMVERRFAGTRLQASGTVVFEAVLAPEGNSFMLLERTEVDAAAPPDKIIGGKLDRDGDTDLMWSMGIVARRRVFQVSLALRVGGVPLTAMTSGPNPVSTATAAPLDFTAADLNGLHADELILFTQAAVTIYSPDE
ncbi:MAG TPA: hypothetical protein VK601_15330, partial [Kofleriaceae bacterium]|nr:hypothetical protein [Kofleriaceae bacterium]